MNAQAHNPWDLVDPAETLAQIIGRGRARPGTTLVAYVDIASQDVQRIRRLPTPTPYLGEVEEDEYWAMRALSDDLRGLAQEMAPIRTFDGNRWSRMTGVLVTVVCREGQPVSTDDEWQFWAAWRYSNHLTAAFEGEVYVVTPHGWTGTLSEQGGEAPALDSRHVLAAVPSDG